MKIFDLKTMEVKKMSELLKQTDIPYEKGYLYFVKNIEGKCAMFKVKMQHGRKKKS